MKTPKINIGKLLKQIDSFGYDAKRLAVAQTNVTAENIVNDARQRAPVNYNQLRLSINKTKAEINNNRSYISAGVFYAPYVEFGTGRKVSVPKGFEQLAAKYKGKGPGNFDQFLDAIRDWCRKKGIDEKLAYPFAVSILRNGVRAQPFLIPAYLTGLNQYGKKLVAILERNVKLYNNKK